MCYRETILALPAIFPKKAAELGRRTMSNFRQIA
jgi:hypothetical protein